DSVKLGGFFLPLFRSVLQSAPMRYAQWRSESSRLRQQLKILTRLFTLVVIASCSDPHGWTLWLHTYSVEGDTLNPTHDEWSSFNTYGSSADCKNQIESHLILLEKSYQESKTLLEDYRLMIE